MRSPAGPHVVVASSVAECRNYYGVTSSKRKGKREAENSMKERTVQVSERLLDGVEYVLANLNLENQTPEVVRSVIWLQGEIEQKRAAQKRRQKFTEYKQTKLGDERDRKRIEYMQEAGIPRKFQSSKEYPNQEPPKL